MSRDPSKAREDTAASKRHTSSTRNGVHRTTANAEQDRSSATSFADRIKLVETRKDELKAFLRTSNPTKILLSQVNQWEKASLAHIKSKAEERRNELKCQIQDSISTMNGSITELTKEMQLKLHARRCTENDVERWTEILEQYQHEAEQAFQIPLNMKALSLIQLVTFDTESTASLATEEIHSREKPKAKKEQRRVSVDDLLDERPNGAHASGNQIVPPQGYAYPSIVLGTDESDRPKMYALFQKLRSLAAMDKNGPMNGNCDTETTQMEIFLSENFGFRNRSGRYIVQGVKSFRLDRPPAKLDPKTPIYFPQHTKQSFRMTVHEILKWQRSYAVYADASITGMSKEFIRSALQGLSKSGDEAFRMKFVVRVSKCPILMEFNARIIPRDLKHDWPHRIKLVSVTGVDFAGRIHDVNDIINYVANWTDIYELDPRTAMPLVHHGRDFRVKARAPQGRLHEKTLLRDLMRMARLRLYACDKEKVEVVVETGIGLGVFAGRNIGVDTRVKQISALAIRRVLEEDGSSYENIRAVVFALPIFDGDMRDGRRQDVFQAFVDEFEKKKYQGCVPVLIADQDMHRVTVAIAMSGYRVSELNPADSHGVFGEYWQNRGPAVEEKLALTTAGLLVQHHLINPHVLDVNNYHLVSLKNDDNEK